MSERSDLDQFIEGLRRNLFPEQARLGFSMGIDLEAQLSAIKMLLSRQRQAHEEWVQQVDGLLKEARQNENTLEYPYTDERWIDRMRDGTFLSAAHSMAAVAMLAPFLEMLFKRIFEHLGMELWNRGIVANIKKRADSVGLTAWFPDAYLMVLKALIEYRNAMFHNGFEWPDKELSDFRKAITDGGWPNNWFVETHLDGDSRVFLMEPEFIEDCFQTIEGIRDGFCAFLRDRSNNARAQDQGRD